MNHASAQCEAMNQCIGCHQEKGEIMEMVINIVNIWLATAQPRPFPTMWYKLLQVENDAEGV